MAGPQFSRNAALLNVLRESKNQWEAQKIDVVELNQQIAVDVKKVLASIQSYSEVVKLLNPLTMKTFQALQDAKSRGAPFNHDDYIKEMNEKIAELNLKKANATAAVEGLLEKNFFASLQKIKTQEFTLKKELEKAGQDIAVNFPDEIKKQLAKHHLACLESLNEAIKNAADPTLQMARALKLLIQASASKPAEVVAGAGSGPGKNRW